MFIDTHAHVYLDVFREDLDEVISRARDNGVECIVLPAIDVASIHAAIDLCVRYDGLYAMAALHPSETKESTDFDFERVVDLCEDPHVVAIGETGLDYYWDRSFDQRQHTFLRRHIRLAAERRLPIVFHNREAFDDLIDVVEDEQERMDDARALSGVFHCFTGTKAQADRVRQAGFVVGIGGILTFKNGGIDDDVRQIPLEHIVLETDAPYLTPEPHRGGRNEPAYVRFVAERLAELKDLSLDDVAEVTTATARSVFGI